MSQRLNGLNSVFGHKLEDLFLRYQGLIWSLHILQSRATITDALLKDARECFSHDVFKALSRYYLKHTSLHWHIDRND